jgi:hypothetical protein
MYEQVVTFHADKMGGHTLLTALPAWGCWTHETVRKVLVLVHVSNQLLSNVFCNRILLQKTMTKAKLIYAQNANHRVLL